MPTTTNTHGGVGLLQMPSARMRPDGDTVTGFVLSQRRQSVFLGGQLLPWLEVAARIESTPQAQGIGGRLADRALDLKLRLLPEDDWQPALALGFRDIGGDGPSAAEYLVASKRFWGLDVTLGLGWGRLGSIGDMRNPLALDRLWPGIDHRRAAGPFGGRRTGFFGGLDWQVPAQQTTWGEVPAIRLLAEFSSDRFRDAATGWPPGSALGRVARSRLAFGLEWTQAPGGEVGIVFLHGTDLLLRASWRLQLDKPYLPALDDPPLLQPRLAAGFDGAAEMIRNALLDAGFRPLQVDIEGLRARIAVESLPQRSLALVAGRVMRAAQPLLPPGVELVQLEWRRRGVTLARLDLSRREFEAAGLRRGSAEEVFAAARLQPARRQARDDAWPLLGWALQPQLLVLPGDNRAALRGMAAASAGLRLQLPAGLAVEAAVQQVLASNLATYQPARTPWPRVRSDLPAYAHAGPTAIRHLYAEGLWNLGPDWFGRLAAGLLEPMFAGVAAELLWRPAGAGHALGLEAAWLRQRGYRQRFALRDYQVVTAQGVLHAGLPWWNLQAVLRGGRYLAGDWGGGLELSRRFDSGIELGAFVTATQAAHRASGPRAVDQGFFIRAPLPWQWAMPSGGMATSYRPAIRDGGQRLAMDQDLYSLVRDGRAEAFRRGFQDLLR